MRLCSIEECGRPSRKRGWCEGHYYHFKVRGTPYGRRRNQSSECSADACTGKPIAKGLCENHYRLARRQQMAAANPKEPSPPPPPCSVLECDVDARVRGWCGKHYQRWRRFGDPTFHPPEQPRRCSVADCDKTSNARSLCAAHYRRWQLYGDPLITKHVSQLAEPGDRVCPVADCDRRVRPGGRMCVMHYHRHSKHGDINMVPKLANRTCATCGVDFSPGNGKARKYCSKLCKPSGRISGSVNKRSWVEILGEEDGWDCWLCREPVDKALYWPNPQAGSVDHVLPVSLNGSDARENLRLSHLTCNTARKNKLVMT